MATGTSATVANGTGAPVSSSQENDDGVMVDHYGFVYTAKEADLHYIKDIGTKEIHKREAKWLKVLANFDHWMLKKPEKIKKYCRKGIPSSLRSRAWMALSGAAVLKKQHPENFYHDLLTWDDTTWCGLIDKDLDRTFPEHEQFSADTTFHQDNSMNLLRDVLKAYSIFNADIGYCQAMAPVTAALLMQMSAEDSFWCLVAICRYYVPGYYSQGLRQVKMDAAILDGLIHKFLPVIDAHFSKCDDSSERVDPLLYCTEWFMSFYTRALPWSCVLRVWDMFLFEGVKVLFRTALAILQLTFGSPESRTNCTGFYDITKKLRNLRIEITHEDTLIPQILSFKVTSTDLAKEHRRQENSKEIDVRYDPNASIRRRTVKAKMKK